VTVSSGWLTGLSAAPSLLMPLLVLAFGRDASRAYHQEPEIRPTGQCLINAQTVNVDSDAQPDRALVSPIWRLHGS
jgi:hypothetical protein